MANREPDIEPTQVVGEFTSADIETPGDSAEPRIKVPRFGRSRILGSGEGDICIYAVDDGSGGLPRGSLIPIAGVPRFETGSEAKRWLKTSSGDLLADKQIIIFRAIDIVHVVSRTVTQVELLSKERIFRRDPDLEMP